MYYISIVAMYYISIVAMYYISIVAMYISIVPPFLSIPESQLNLYTYPCLYTLVNRPKKVNCLFPERSEKIRVGGLKILTFFQKCFVHVLC